ncbi:MAG TPA: ribosome maturation factor RimM [Vicinamibacterales bacterium]|nr:ribosome maturation factor RimM [Vicinamibacterales bacterium]
MAVVGMIARAHGNRGQVIVNPETDFPDERFQAGAELFIERGGAAAPMRIIAMRLQQDRPVIAFDGVASMDDAEALAGKELRVPMDRLAALPHDTFYHHDLVGCRVETRGGATVGIVRRVDGTAGGSRLVVAREAGAPGLENGARGDVEIPLVADICTTVDIGAKRIVIDPPEGLLDLNP